MVLPTAAHRRPLRSTFLQLALAIPALALVSTAWSRDDRHDDRGRPQSPDRHFQQERHHDRSRHESWGPPRGPQPPAIRYDFDRRWGHDHYYPRLGEVIWTLPGGSVSISVGSGYFHYHAGNWYRPYGSYWRVVSAPVGVVVPVLPSVAVILRLGDVRYWYANGVYYRPHHHGGYVVVAAPVGPLVRDEEGSALPGASVAAPVVVSSERPAVKRQPDPIIYPRKGQSPQQQEADLQACNRWATAQPAAVAEAEAFSRAVEACMDGRDYSMR